MREACDASSEISTIRRYLLVVVQERQSVYDTASLQTRGSLCAWPLLVAVKGGNPYVTRHIYRRVARCAHGRYSLLSREAIRMWHVIYTDAWLHLALRSYGRDLALLYSAFRALLRHRPLTYPCAGAAAAGAEAAAAAWRSHSLYCAEARARARARARVRTRARAGVCREVQIGRGRCTTHEDTDKENRASNRDPRARAGAGHRTDAGGELGAGRGRRDDTRRTRGQAREAPRASDTLRASPRQTDRAESGGGWEQHHPT